MEWISLAALLALTAGMVFVGAWARGASAGEQTALERAERAEETARVEADRADRLAVRVEAFESAAHVPQDPNARQRWAHEMVNRWRDYERVNHEDLVRNGLPDG